MSAATETPLHTDADMIAYGGLTCATFCWASAFIAGKFALAEMSPLTVAVWRYAIAGLLLLPFAWRQRATADFGATIGPLAIMVVCGGVIYPWVFLLALQRTSATNTALLIALNPVFTVLLAPLIGEALTRQRLTGVLVALFGAALVITHGDLEIVRTLAMNSGDLLAVLAALTWSAFNLASRRTMSRITPAVANAVIYLIGSVAFAFLSLPDAPLGQLVHASSGARWSVVAMAVLSSVLGGQMFLAGVRTLGVSRSVVFVYVVPVLTAMLSALFLGDRFAVAQGIGGTAVLAGVYLSTQRS